jgi:hypothetical protein
MLCLHIPCLFHVNCLTKDISCISKLGELRPTSPRFLLSIFFPLSEHIQLAGFVFWFCFDWSSPGLIFITSSYSFGNHLPGELWGCLESPVSWTPLASPPSPEMLPEPGDHLMRKSWPCYQPVKSQLERQIHCLKMVECLSNRGLNWFQITSSFTR